VYAQTGPLLSKRPRSTTRPDDGNGYSGYVTLVAREGQSGTAQTNTLSHKFQVSLSTWHGEVTLTGYNISGDSS
jgi:hypothetical protein